MSTIAALLNPRDIVLDLAVSTKAELIEMIGRHMEQVHGMPAEWVTVSLSRREQVGSTGIGDGVAIPHARVRDLDRIKVAYLRLKHSLPFDAPDGKPVSDVIVLLVPKQATEEHLRILAEATQLFSNPAFRRALQGCTQPAEVKALFEDWHVSA